MFDVPPGPRRAVAVQCRHDGSIVVFCLDAKQTESYPMPSDTRPGDVLRVLQRMLGHLDPKEVTIMVERPSEGTEVWTTSRPPVALYRLAVALSSWVAADLPHTGRTNRRSEGDDVASA